MRVVTVNTHDSVGGAARVAAKIREGLAARGFESLFTAAYADNASTIPWDSAAWRSARRVTSALERRLSLQYVLEPTVLRGVGGPLAGADAVLLHNLHGNYFNMAILPQLSRRTRVVLTLHDMWSFTGKCVHARECSRWESGCGRCPRLSDYPVIARDTSAFHLRRKRRIYSRSRLTVVCPSTWLLEKARRSVLGSADLRHIPNGVDCHMFRPMDASVERERLGVPADDKVVLFVGSGGIANRHKGFASLREALEAIQCGSLTLVIVGEEGPAPDVGRCRVVNVGRLEDVDRMAAIYSAADVVAMPSQDEVLPLVGLEALACGTPVVAFDVGGVGEYVRHGETGFLVPAGDVLGLTEGLERALQSGDLRHRLGESGRALVGAHFNVEGQIEAYARLLCEPIGG